jgi:hypothetical protein
VYNYIQIERSCSSKESVWKLSPLPNNVYRIGSGGATLHILELLSDLHGDRLETWRTLIIHAGTHAQTKPNGGHSNLSPQIVNPQILGIIWLSQIRKFPRCASPQSQIRNFLLWLIRNFFLCSSLLIAIFHLRAARMKFQGWFYLADIACYKLTKHLGQKIDDICLPFYLFYFMIMLSTVCVVF